MGKRIVKSPKVYVRDSGVLHALLGLVRHADLESHPKLGASWEGFALEQALARAGDRHAYFWGTYGGAEIDPCLMRGSMRLGLEFKYTSSPEVTKSMRVARADLRLDRVAVVVPGDKVFPLDEQTTAVGLALLQHWLHA